MMPGLSNSSQVRIGVFARRLKVSCGIASALIALGALVNPAFCAEDGTAKPLSRPEVLEKTAPALVAVDCLGDEHTREMSALG